jgi:integrase
MRVRNGEYHADFYANGRRVRKRLSGDFGAACTILNELKARADRADFGLLDNDYPLAKLREEFMRHCRQARKPATVRRYGFSLDAVLPRLGAARACQVTREAVVVFRQERLAGGVCPNTVNQDVGALRAMLNWGVKSGLIGSNPLRGLEALSHDNPKEGRPLTEGEVRRLLEASRPPWRDIWYAFLVTGMRKAELSALTFRDVDWGGRELIVRGSVAKNHRERRIPIDAGLWGILKGQEAGREGRQPGVGQTAEITAKVRELFSRDHVFVTTQNTPVGRRNGLYYAFLRCCTRAGIQTQAEEVGGRHGEHVDPHSLRRTFATSLIVSGADPKSVQELLGHRTLDMTMRIYAKVRSQTKRQALARLPYGQGTLAPEGVLEYPSQEGLAVQNGHQTVTGPKEAAGG